MTVRRPPPSARLEQIYFALPTAAALLAVGLVFAAPSEGSNAWLLGLSRVRWVLVLALLAAAAAFAWLLLQARAATPRWRRWASRALAWLRQPGAGIGLALFLAGLGAVFLYLCLLALSFQDDFVAARLQRLVPLFAFIIFLCLHNLIVLWLIRNGERARNSAEARRWLAAFFVFAALLGVAAVFIVRIGLGLTPDRTGWDNPGAPLLATQVLLACWLAGLGLLGVSFLQVRWPKARTEWVVCAILWVIAVVAWQTQPLTPTFFSPRPVPPANQFFPYSDAATHDLIAQNLLIGEGFTPAAEKPLYSFFLAGLHAMLGQDYASIVNAQIWVLALLPVALYLLASRMQHRFSGLLLALLVILRERNTIALSGQISVSHSKLLMTDLPTALALALLALLILRWLAADRRALRWPLFAGAALGALTLLRSQSLIFLPVLLALSFWTGGKVWQARFKYALVLLLGFLALALPWMVRNGLESGQFGFSQPLQGLYLAKQYSLTPEANDPGFPPDTPPSDYARLGFASAMQFARANPALVAQFITAHFLHNEVSAFLALPMRFDLTQKLVTFYDLRPYWIGLEGRLWSQCCSLDTYVSETPYWSGWLGQIPAEAILPLVFNLAMIALGLAAAWRRLGWAGLAPAAMHLAYNLSTAIARVSGWRLNLPVDWALLLYYALGLGQLSLWLWAAFGPASKAKPVKKARQNKARFGWKAESLGRLVAVLVAASLLMPLVEWAVPPRYARLNEAEAMRRAANLIGFDAAAFLGQPAAVALNGRALWPRYYAAGEGEPGGQWPAFNPLPFSRLGFVLVGPQGAQVVLPSAQAPLGFNNGADVIVFGCQQGDYVKAVAVLDGSQAGWLAQPASLACE